MADQTVTELIKMSLRKIGAIAAGETPSDAEMQDALIQLRAMLRQWSSQATYVFKTTVITHSLDNSESYTIGSGADIDTTRPVSIRSGFVSSAGVDYPLRIVGPDKYAKVYDKDLGGTYPIYLWYNPGYSQGTVYVWPPGGGTMNLYCLVPLTDPTTLTEDIVLPGEYDQAIVWSLACLMAPEYGREPTGFMQRTAQMAMDDVMIINASLAVDEAVLDRMDGRTTLVGYNIDAG